MDEQKLVLDALQMGATPETMNSWLIKNVGGAPPTLASGMAGFSSFMNDITRGWKEGAIGPYSGARYNDLIELQRVARSAGWEYDPDAPVNNWRQRNIDDFVNYQKSYAPGFIERKLSNDLDAQKREEAFSKFVEEIYGGGDTTTIGGSVVHGDLHITVQVTGTADQGEGIANAIVDKLKGALDDETTNSENTLRIANASLGVAPV